MKMYFFFLLEIRSNKGKSELILMSESFTVSLSVIFLLQKSLFIKTSFPKVSILAVISADRCCS